MINKPWTNVFLPHFKDQSETLRMSYETIVGDFLITSKVSKKHKKYVRDTFIHAL